MPYLKPTDYQWKEGRGYRKAVLLQDSHLQAPGTLVQIIEFAPQSSVPPHHHKTTLEVFHMLEGRGTMTVDGRQYDLIPGDTLTCEPPAIHDAANPHDTPWRFIVFKTNVTPDDLYWVES